MAAWDGTVDFETALSTFHEDVVIRRMPPLPDPRSAKGREGVLEVIADWIEDFDDFEMRGEEYVDAGDYVIVQVIQSARGGGSGVPVEGTFWFVYEVADDKVRRLEMYATRSQAHAAAGLSE